MSEKLLIECSRYPTPQQKTPALSTEVRGKSFLSMADTDGAGMYEIGDRSRKREQCDFVRRLKKSAIAKNQI
ncbi:hypothetical protein [Nostoc favosum]|uniref:Uncharacterized protein n=1 Tax=Nostoc favosum CHAB5714 TaxID=2780399 RepID=A0ABS8II47_9NOSO|nr:hypothetical protein [Nostoc favosum]MCC5603187.1 hypothetical protein [Nostoc favosum CHAB5714]